MPGSDRFYIGHMLDHTRKVIQISQGKARKEFDANLAMRLALVHLLQIIGEAARLISPDYKNSHPEIDWRNIVGMRHRIVHEYFNIDENIVWSVVQDDIPKLLQALDDLAIEEPPIPPPF